MKTFIEYLVLNYSLRNVGETVHPSVFIKYAQVDAIIERNMDEKYSTEF